MSLSFGLVVRIFGFYPGGPGSIPGMGTFLLVSMMHEGRKVKSIGQVRFLCLSHVV